MAQISLQRVVGSPTTASTSIVDMSGMSVSVTLTQSAHIIAWMSSGPSVSVVPSTSYFAININGVDSPVISRYFATAAINGSVGVTYRTVTPLAAGTYTIKGRFYTTAGTLSATSTTLIAMALEDSTSSVFNSIYDTVASDTTTSNVMEDIDGLTQNIVSNSENIFTTLAGSESVSTKNRSNYLAANVNGTDLVTIQRYHTVASQPGSVTISARTVTAPTGTVTCKGRWYTGSPGDTATIAPSILTSFVLGNESRQIPSNRTATATETTSSAVVENIPNTSHSIVLSETSHVFASLTLASSCDKNSRNGYFGISINSIDSPLVTRFHGTAGDPGSVIVC